MLLSKQFHYPKIDYRKKKYLCSESKKVCAITCLTKQNERCKGTWHDMAKMLYFYQIYVILLLLVKKISKNLFICHASTNWLGTWFFACTYETVRWSFLPTLYVKSFHMPFVWLESCYDAFHSIIDHQPKWF